MHVSTYNAIEVEEYMDSDNIFIKLAKEIYELKGYSSLMKFRRYITEFDSESRSIVSDINRLKLSEMNNINFILKVKNSEDREISTQEGKDYVVKRIQNSMNKLVRSLDEFDSTKMRSLKEDIIRIFGSVKEDYLVRNFENNTDFKYGSKQFYKSLFSDAEQDITIVIGQLDKFIEEKNPVNMYPRTPLVGDGKKKQWVISSVVPVGFGDISSRVYNNALSIYRSGKSFVKKKKGLENENMTKVFRYYAFFGFGFTIYFYRLTVWNYLSSIFKDTQVFPYIQLFLEPLIPNNLP